MTFRAAYLPAAADSTSGGLLLTTEDQAHLSDEALREAARATIAEMSIEADAADIVIGDWRA